jgi:hypothetical protein
VKKPGPPPMGPFASASQKTITQLPKATVYHAMQGGSWQKRYVYALWHNKFQAWRVSILSVEYVLHILRTSSSL